LGWMENLGVVPLLRSLALRLTPARRSRLFLLLLVIFVLETITTPIIIINLGVFLPTSGQIVKKITLMLVILTIQLASAAPPKAKNLIIAKGEHREITLHSKDSFTVGNREIIRHTTKPQKGILLIKGDKLGFTELVIWRHLRGKERYNIYVLDKRRQLKILHLEQIVRSLGLTTELSGPLIIAQGEVVDISKYNLLRRLLKESPQAIHFQGALAPQLRNHIIGDIYYHFFNHHIDSINCQPEIFSTLCQYDQSTTPSAKIVKYLKAKYSINFIPTPTHHPHDQYRLKMKIIQSEQAYGSQVSIGLYPLQGMLNELFSIGLAALIRKNPFYFSRRNTSYSTLAEPESIILPGVESTIRVGREISYPDHQLNSDRPQMKWKFAGLTIKVKILRVGKKLKLNYSTSFDRIADGGGEVVGSRESSAALVLPGKPQQLFQVGHLSQGEVQEGIPLLSKIPLIGSLFGTSSYQQSYKTISAMVLLEKL
jgi:hypothetical protein